MGFIHTNSILHLKFSNYVVHYFAFKGTSGLLSRIPILKKTASAVSASCSANVGIDVYSVLAILFVTDIDDNVLAKAFKIEFVNVQMIKAGPVATAETLYCYYF